MPRKRKHVGNKESQIIRTRLIELSMKVEDVIYHKTTLTESEAETIIKEVTSYKRDCSHDERSLQVIEKLIRCMKAIIAEHQQERLSGHYTNDVNEYLDNIRANSVSPVYSLPDEDRTQLTQEQSSVDLANEINEIDKNTCVQNDDYDRTQFTQAVQHDATDYNYEITEIIDLCEDDEDNAAAVIESTIVNEDVDMQKALSNLSVRDVNHQCERMAIDVECSQSILNNFEEINITQHNKVSNIVSNGTMPVNCVEVAKSINMKVCDGNNKLQNQTPVLSTNTINILKPINITSSNIKPIGVVTKTYNPNNPFQKKVSNAINGAGLFQKLLKAKQTTISTKNVFVSDKSNVVVSNALNYTQQKCTSASYNKSVTNTYTNIHDEISRADNTLSRIEPKNKVRENISKQNAIEKKDRKPRKKKDSKTKTNGNETVNIIDSTKKVLNSINKATKTGPKRIYARKKKHDKNNVTKKDSSIPIYNKNVENDLSWLEGIRFVREVTEDEFDRELAGLNDNFWDNYYLPPNFDGSDFL